MRWRAPHRTTVVVGVAVVVLVGGGTVALRVTTGHATTAPAAGAAATASVTRTDLSTTQQVNGTLGFDGSYTVINLLGTTQSQRATAQQQLAQALAQRNAGNQAAADARATSAAQTGADQALLDQYTTAVAADQRQLTADQDQLARDTAQQTTDCATPATPPGGTSAACTADRTAVSTDTTHVSTDQTALVRDQQNMVQAQGKVRVDQAQGRQAADAAQAQADQAAANAQAIIAGGATTAPTTVTSVPKIGDTIQNGQSLYALDGRPVVLLVGDTPILRQLAVGVPDGPDIAVLKQALTALGFTPGPVNGHFDTATATAVRNWQRGLGIPADGVVRVGDVFVEPTAVRVTGVNVSAGAAANPGGTVLTGTSPNPVVNVPLSPAKEYLVHTGDPVLVDLPDGRTTAHGHIRDISTVATSTSGSGSGTGSGAGPGGSAGGPGAGPGGGAAQSQQQGQQALAGNTTVSVTVTLDNPASVRPLDQAPVQVDITDQTVRGVLAVPVEALLALAGGGYGLQLVTAAGTRTVAVQVGLFGNGMVQVSGPGVVAGATVAVPSS